MSNAKQSIGPDVGRIHHYELCVVKPQWGLRPGYVDPDRAEQRDAVNECPVCLQLIGRCRCGDVW